MDAAALGGAKQGARRSARTMPSPEWLDAPENAREVLQRNHKPHSWGSPYARRLPSIHRSNSAHALAHPNPNCIGIPRCLLIRGDTTAEN
eukprot:scaffold91545_cov69-Phaeocystis_antarctica.AAC.2